MSDLYDNGIMNILRMIPKTLEENERLLIEGVVYTSFGYFRSYQALEALLDQHTSDDGVFLNTYASNRDAFSLAWSAVDAAYALGRLGNLKTARGVFKLSEETLESIESASSARNYMDHLPSNFRNVATSRGYSPLFGWLSYQYTPHYRDSSITPNLMYINQFASTHLKDEFASDAKKLASDAVLASIDNVCITIRKSEIINLSRILSNLILDLNDFSIETQQRLLALWDDPDFDHGGVRIPFPMIQIRGDRETPVDIYDVASALNRNKVRAEVHIETSD